MAAALAATLALAAAPGGAAAQAPAKAAQAAAVRAVLERGTLRVRGIPFAASGFADCRFGEYRVEGGAAGARFRAWFTREAVPVGAGWTRARPAEALPAGSVAYAFAGAAPDGYEGWTAYLVETGSYAAVVAFSGGVARGTAILSVFLERLSFFMRNAEGDAFFSFPAVLLVP